MYYKVRLISYLRKMLGAYRFAEIPARGAAGTALGSEISPNTSKNAQLEFNGPFWSDQAYRPSSSRKKWASENEPPSACRTTIKWSEEIT